MDISTIYTTLTTRLKTVTSLPTVQEENNRTNLKTSFSRATIIPARTNILTLGPNGINQVRGIYQVDLFILADSSYVSGYALTDSILQKFIAGTTLSGIKIDNAYTLPSQQTSIPNYHMFSVAVEWSSYEERGNII